MANNKENTEPNPQRPSSQTKKADSKPIPPKMSSRKNTPQPSNNKADSDTDIDAEYVSDDGASVINTQASRPDVEEAAFKTDPRKYFPVPPTGYIYQNKVPKVPMVMAPTGQLKRKSKYKANPETREYYDSKGSVEKPQDGDKVKPEAGRCLNCIKSSNRCHGTSVKDGKCLNCQGYNLKMERARQSRVCRWKTASRNVYTYSQHVQTFGGTEIRQNTAAAKRQNEEPYVTIFQAPFITGYERQVLGWLVTGALGTNLADDDTSLNLDILYNVVRARYMWARDLTPAQAQGPFNSQQDRQNFLAVLNHMYRRLQMMKRDGDGIEYNDFLAWLPENHQLYKR